MRELHLPCQASEPPAWVGWRRLCIEMLVAVLIGTGLVQLVSAPSASPVQVFHGVTAGSKGGAR